MPSNRTLWIFAACLGVVLLLSIAAVVAMALDRVASVDDSATVGDVFEVKGLKHKLVLASSGFQVASAEGQRVTNYGNNFVCCVKTWTDSPTVRQDFQRWGGKVPIRSFATLTDEFGNVYHGAKWEEERQGLHNLEVIKQGKAVYSIMYFERPIPAARKVYLDLITRDDHGNQYSIHYTITISRP